MNFSSLSYPRLRELGVLRVLAAEDDTLDEVPTGQRPPIFKRYLELAPGARPHIPVDRAAPLPDFERIAASYPVFPHQRGGFALAANHVTIRDRRRIDRGARCRLVITNTLGDRARGEEASAG
jgi:hypothetical protein